MSFRPALVVTRDCIFSSKRHTVFAAGLFLLLPFGCGTVFADGQVPTLSVGVSEIDITPPVGFRKGGGYTEVISKSVDDPLFAKAIVLRQRDVAFAIVLNDLLSVPPDLSRRARIASAEQTGIPVENIVIAATHNHGSPEYWGVLRDEPHRVAVASSGHDPHEPIDYQNELVNAWTAAIAAASESARPSEMTFGVTSQEGIAFNRRFHMRDGSVRFNPGVKNPDIIRPAGPVDEQFPFLLFHHQTATANPFAAFSTFAIHTAVGGGGTAFSADFPAVLQRRLRSEFGPSFLSVFAEGAAGDVNHIDVSIGNPLRGHPEVERIGNALAETFDNLQPQLKPVRNVNLAVASRTAFAPFKPISKALYEDAKASLFGEGSIPFLTRVAAWRDCHRYHHTVNYGSEKPLEVQAVRLTDDLAIVTLPHEVFVEIGLAIKATSPFRNTLVVSLANDVDYYIPTRRAFEEGSYEVTTCPLLPGCGELLLDTARETLNSLKQLP